MGFEIVSEAGFGGVTGLGLTASLPVKLDGLETFLSSGDLLATNGFVFDSTAKLLVVVCSL